MGAQRIILKGIITVLVSLPLICNSLAFAERWTVESLQKEIDARGYKWKAGKTALSELSIEESEEPIRFPCDEGAPYMMPEEGRVTLPDDFPTFLDWRNYKGGNWITPVKNQLPLCGSCYAFGQLGTMETLIRLHHNDPDLPIDLSEQYLVSCIPKSPMCHKWQGQLGGCYGMWTDVVLDFLIDSGVPDEECFPYQTPQWKGIEPQCTEVCDDVASRVHKLSSYSFISGDMVSIPHPENIKAVLVNKPVTVQMEGNPLDWIFYTGGIYEPTPGPRAGHMVEIIGFDDAQQCWICKNSQGTDWGETVDFKPYTPGAGDGGYFRIAYVTSLEDSLTHIGINAVDEYYDGGPPVLPPTSTTTTTISCPSEEIYGNSSKETQLLRSIRDNVLGKSQEGRELIKLYYQWSPVVLKTMREDEGFRETVKEMIDEILMAIAEGRNK